MAEKEATKEKVASAFEEADVEKSGKISEPQLRVIMDLLTINLKDLDIEEETLNKLLKICSLDGKITVSLEDLLIIMFGDEHETLGAFLRLADKDGRGYITAKDLKFIMEIVDEGDRFNDTFIKYFMALADKNEDKKLQYEEITNFLKDGLQQMDDPKVLAKAMFKVHDKNADGYIDKKELRQFFEEMEDDEEGVDNMMVNMMMAMLDTDEDGKLNFEEFSAMLE